MSVEQEKDIRAREIQNRTDQALKLLKSATTKDEMLRAFVSIFWIQKEFQMHDTEWSKFLAAHPEIAPEMENASIRVTGRAAFNIEEIMAMDEQMRNTKGADA